MARMYRRPKPMISLRVEGLDRVTKALDMLGEWTSRPMVWGSLFADEAQEALEGATETWRDRPRFTVHGRTKGRSELWLEINASPALPYLYVDRGTRAHAIRPKRPNGVLVFNSQFGAKSRANSLRAYVGHSRGPKVVTRAVWHPGIKARNFTTLAAERAQRNGIRSVESEVKTIMREGASLARPWWR